jgi:ABC-type multidrug transport system fused ATPase/permease subunit
VRGKISFQEVAFAYEQSKTLSLDRVSFTVEPGQITALVGASGAGKSTVISLLARFYDPTEGRILIDDHDIRDLKINYLRRTISLVQQESFIFSGTIADNVRMGRLEASEEQVKEALQQAKAWDFVLSLPQGIHTQLGEQGIHLSGGQKQLISVSRAVLRNAPIVLLDEATAAMDNETEFLVRESLLNLLRNRTSIIIAHRLQTVRKADQILVMKHGRIVERGSHDGLLAQNGYYKKLYETDFAGQGGVVAPSPKPG